MKVEQFEFCDLDKETGQPVLDSPTRSIVVQKFPTIITNMALVCSLRIFRSEQGLVEIGLYGHGPEGLDSSKGHVLSFTVVVGPGEKSAVVTWKEKIDWMKVEKPGVYLFRLLNRRKELARLALKVDGGLGERHAWSHPGR